MLPDEERRVTQAGSKGIKQIGKKSEQEKKEQVV